MRKLIVYFLFLFSWIIAFPQEGNPDSVAVEKLYKDKHFRHDLSLSYKKSTAGASLNLLGAGFICAGGFSMYSPGTGIGIALSGFGFGINLIPSMALSHARMTMEKCGFGEVPGNEIYRTIRLAHELALMSTVAGLVSVCATTYGIVDKNPVMYGFGLACMLGSMVASFGVPFLVDDAIKLYDRGKAHIWIEVRDEGVGVSYSIPGK
jgi:hypothetical protein